MQTANIIIETAKKTLTVVAASRILLEMSGEEQLNQATAILSSRRQIFPQSLVKLLEAKAKPSPKTTSEAKTKRKE